MTSLPSSAAYLMAETSPCVLFVLQTFNMWPSLPHVQHSVCAVSVFSESFFFRCVRLPRCRSELFQHSRLEWPSLTQIGQGFFNLSEIAPLPSWLCCFPLFVPESVEVLLLWRDLRRVDGLRVVRSCGLCLSSFVDLGLEEVPTWESARVEHEISLQGALRQHTEGQADSDVLRKRLGADVFVSVDIAVVLRNAANDFAFEGEAGKPLQQTRAASHQDGS